VNSNFGDAMVSMLQPRNQLENRESKNDEMFRGVQKTVETSVREVGLGEAERERSKRRSRKKMGRKGKRDEAEEKKDSRSKKNSQGMRNLG